MKHVMRIMMLLVAIVPVACSEDNVLDDYDNTAIIDNSTSSSTTSTSIGELSSFDIAIDKTPLSETELTGSDEDLLSNNTFGSTVTITFSDNSYSVDGAVDGVDFSQSSGADVIVNSSVAGINYVLTGSTSNGMFKVYSSKKYQLTLNGISITNGDGPALNLQSGKRAYIYAADGTSNTFTDGSSYVSSDEDQKGTVFSEGKLLFSGAGLVTVNGNTKNGIASDDYIKVFPGANIYVKATAGHGIKANDSIIVKGGVMVRATGGEGSEGIESKAVMTINDGTVQVLAYDDAINSSSHLYIKGGSVLAYSTGNDGLDSNGNMYIQGGTTVAYGTRQPECGIDANEEGGYSVYFLGGNLFAIGGGNSVPSSSQSTQGYVTTTGTVSAGSTATISSGSTTLATFSLPASYSSGSVLVTANGMKSGSSYTLSVGSSSTTLTAVQYGSSGMGGGMGGGRPGGR
jgi:hypothetical protein